MRRQFKPKRGYASKKTCYRKKKVYRSKSYQNTVIGGVPKFQFVTLKYADTLELVQSAGGVSATRVYRGNSIYDPDYSGTLQNTVANYNFWLGQYNRYAVIDSTIRVTFQANSNVPMYCYIAPYYAAGTFPVNVTDWDELPGIKKVNLQGISAGNSTSRTISVHCKTKYQMGESIDSVDSSSPFGATPARQFFYWVALHSVDSSVNPGCLIRVEIFYRTKLYERRALTGY